MNASRVTGPALPLQLTRFIGREREIEAVTQMLARTRLLTITGAGGSGKTRLALEAAGRIAEREHHEVACIELAPLSDPDLLPHQIASALGFPEEPGRSATDTIVASIGDRSLLLVLDNCEHLVDHCAALVDRMLRTCPDLRVLATSREALGVAGETAWLVPPLSLPEPGTLPSPDRLIDYEAVHLFVERVHDVLPSFEIGAANAEAVVQVCRRLDGIPLAIELAAARARVLAPEQIAARLDDACRLLTTGSRTAIPRHQTLRATVDWSFRLLSEREQGVLQRLSVFAGHFSLEAAESVCAGEGVESSEVLDLVASLVDRSLVVMREHAGTARYSLLEIVRQYARERSSGDPAGDAAARRRHASHYADLVETALPHIERITSNDWIARLGLEQDNLRAALSWTLTAGHDLPMALRLVSGLWRYWFHSNLWQEGAAWCEAMIAAESGLRTGPEWVRTLNGAGVFAYLAGESERCRLRLEEAEAMGRAFGDKQALALTCYRLAHLNCDLGEHELALARAEEAVQLARVHGEAWLVAEVLAYALAFVHRVQERPELADEAFAEAISLAQEAEAWMPLTEACLGRALLALHRGDVAGAAAHASGAFDAARKLGDDWYLSRALLMAAAAALQGDEAARAATLLGHGAALRDTAGTTLVFAHEQAFCAETSSGVEQSLSVEEFARHWSAGATMSLPEITPLLASPPGGFDVGGGPLESKVNINRRDGALQAAPEAPATAESTAALRALTLGRTEIYLNGQLLSPESWTHTRPMELLLYLLAHPKGRTREQIGLAFWRDSSPAQVKNAFHVVLHHLRKNLGRSDWVIFDGERYRINAEWGIELDAWRFEREMTTALGAARAGALSVDALRSPLLLYGGDFLEDRTVGDWHLEIRDHLRRLYVDGLVTMGERLEAEERFADAVEIYERLVQTEDLNEEAHRRLMRCRSHSGRRDQALRQYERLLILLRDELEAEPEPETRELYDRLRGTAAAR